MADPVVLRVLRPYADEAQYLAAEAWSIDDKGIVLIDQAALPKDTVVRFEVVLEDGSKPVRAEGKVHKLVPAEGDRPGGLKVRFRRFDAATKQFIDRVLEERRKERRSRRPPPAELAPLVLDPEPFAPPVSERPPAEASAPEQSAPEVVSQPLAASDAAEEAEATPPPAPAPRASSGGLGPRSVEAPPNRDELLDRLRARAKAKRAAV